MKFYTNVAIRGNRILHRGYHNGEPFMEEEAFKPSLFVLSQRSNTWKTLDGKNVEPIVFDDIDSAREFTDKYSDVKSYPVYGNTDYMYQFIGEEYPKEISYDLSKMKSRRNPYASKLKKPVTMRLSEDVVAYFKGMAVEAGVPYQSLINLYLRDCVMQHRQVQIIWPGKP